MDVSSVNSDLIRGNVTTIILNSLADGDRYGYDILKEIEDRSEGRYKLKQATLYSCLKRLEKSGLISSYAGDPDVTGGGQRRYYRLTDEGKKYLEKEKQEYEYSRTILDKLVSNDDFDFENRTAPFNADELRPYTKQKEEKKVVYKEKVVYKYIDRPNSPCIIPEKDGAYMSDKEIEFLEESAIKNPSKIYQNGENENIGQSEQQSVANTEQQGSQNTNENLQEETANENVASENANGSYTEEQGFASANSGTASDVPVTNNYETEPTKPRRTLQEVFEEKEREANGQGWQNLSELQSGEQTEQIAPQEPEQFDTRMAFFGNTFDERLDNMIKARKEAAMANALNGNSAEVEPPTHTGTLKIFSVIDDAEGRHYEELKNNPPKPENEILVSETRSRSLKEVLEEKERAANERKKLEQQNAPVEEQTEPEREYATSYVTPKLEGKFEFENSEEPYVDFFDGLTHSEITPAPEKVIEERPIYQDAVLQNRLYSKGYNLKPYEKSNTQNYYYGNFVYINKLRRDSNLIALATYLVLLAILWGTCYMKVTQNLFISALAVGIGLYLIPLITYFVQPKKRSKAKYSFKYAMLNAAMLFIELSVIVALIGFFIVGADVSNPTSVIAPIVVPITLLTTLLFMPICHGLLYNSKKYHIQ